MQQEKDINIDSWKKYIHEKTEDSDKQEALIKYASKLVDKDVPLIFDFTNLSCLLGVPKNILYRIIVNPEKFYCSFDIPKRKGGVREIHAPYPILLNAQKWIYENILMKVKIHDAAKGFIKGHSIVDNAIVHLNKECILKMDIEDFFPSIKKQQVYYIFKWFGYSRKISYNLASICCLDDVLPQGAPTSPILSNIIAKKLDRRLSGMAEKLNITYTRYADDLSFSGNDLSFKVSRYVQEIVEEQGFKINLNKTQYIKGNRQKIITGISVASDKMTIPKKKKREIRLIIYHILSKGLLKHQNSINDYDPIYLERILGYLYFWYSIEPDNNYVKDSISKLRNYSKEFDNFLDSELVRIDFSVK